MSACTCTCFIVKPNSAGQYDIDERVRETYRHTAATHDWTVLGFQFCRKSTVELQDICQACKTTEADANAGLLHAKKANI